MTTNREPSETEKCILVLRSHGFYREANEMERLMIENEKLKYEIAGPDLSD